MKCMDCGADVGFTNCSLYSSLCDQCFDKHENVEKVADDLEWVTNLSDEALQLLAIRLDAARERMNGGTR